MHQKTQENSTSDLIKCLLILENPKNMSKTKINNIINNCKLENKKNIFKELYIRLRQLFLHYFFNIIISFIGFEIQNCCIISNT